MARRPTRLELHRLKFRAESGRVPLLLQEDLSSSEKTQLSGDFFRRCFLEKERDRYEVYGETLADWGVMCPHPEHLQEDGVCRLCNSSQISGPVEPSLPLLAAGRR